MRIAHSFSSGNLRPTSDLGKSPQNDAEDTGARCTAHLQMNGAVQPPDVTAVPG